MSNDKRVPIPPPQEKLFLPVETYAELMRGIDREIRAIMEHEGYGSVAVRINIQDFEISHVGYDIKVSSKNALKLARQRSPIDKDDTL